MPTDWVAWHAAYDAAGSHRRRLAIVQQHIEACLRRASGPVRVISMCAGDGRDLLGVLERFRPPPPVSGRLVELDPVLADRARRRCKALGLDRLEVLTADAGTTTAYAGAGPADLLLLCGVFGNVSPAAIERTVLNLPSLCAAGATVIWTRHRRAPDMTPAVRAWFGRAGFEELSFDAVGGSVASVGSARLAGLPPCYRPGVRLFRFER